MMKGSSVFLQYWPFFVRQESVSILTQVTEVNTLLPAIALTCMLTIAFLLLASFLLRRVTLIS